MLVDFDGTLAPIVDDYHLAMPLPGVSDVLSELADRYATVAVVSGRPIDFLAQNLADAGDTRLFGLYGLQTRRGGSSDVEEPEEAARWRTVLGDSASRAERQSPPKIDVERKGLAVTLHYRNTPNDRAWAEAFAAMEAHRTGLVVHPAKMSVELRPPIDADKGTVVRDLAVGMRAVCFIGDDLGDLPAFAELDRLSTEGVATLAVAVNSGEAPPELLRAASMIVEGPAGALSLLRALAATGRAATAGE